MDNPCPKAELKAFFATDADGGNAQLVANYSGILKPVVSRERAAQAFPAPTCEGEHGAKPQPRQERGDEGAKERGPARDDGDERTERCEGQENRQPQQ